MCLGLRTRMRFGEDYCREENGETFRWLFSMNNPDSDEINYKRQMDRRGEKKSIKHVGRWCCKSFVRLWLVAAEKNLKNRVVIIFDSLMKLRVRLIRALLLLL